MDWESLRAEFPITRRWAFFNHAAVAPLPLAAQRALEAWARDVTENGNAHQADWVRRIEHVRALAGRLLNADSLDVAFIKNTSEGVGIVAEGIRWRAGDNIVTAAEEYPANVYPWMNLAERGVELRTVPLHAGRIRADDIRDALDGRTRLVTLSSVEYATGFRNDLDTVGGMCRERGILFFVDAIQSLGAFPLDVRRTPIDFLTADGHKWLLAPEGAGLFYIRRELVEQLHAVDIGWNSVVNALDFTRVDFRLKPHAGRYESGAMNVCGIIALGASLDLLLQAGIPEVAQRILEVTDYLCEKSAQAGCEVYSSRSHSEKSGIVSLSVPGQDSKAVSRRCKEAGIVVAVRQGRLRVSPHCYNTTAEIDRFIEVLRA